MTRPAVVQHVPDAAEPDETCQNKAIFLFSDGTGNSSAKLFKTNVWRLYEALDLGPAPDDAQVQIAYYDNGVGTSGFRPIRWLGGIFGFGLKRNVLRLYAFLCRNYRRGDRIYAFGFSRGAFTIRILVALIAKQGVLVRPREADLGYHVRQAYREYCRSDSRRPWLPPFAIPARWVRDKLIRFKRIFRGPKVDYFKADRDFADINFVGVWDTVAAYGGPLAELTRGIDDWVWQLSLPNYRLSPRVKVARHALSLDDERDAFWPLIWDEVAEKAMINNGGEIVTGIHCDGKLEKEIRKVDQGRLAQVWFAGVHSDVGGGYPDESLSYVSLMWMMDELIRSQEALPKDQRPRFLKQITDRTSAMTNALGPIHDSRGGAASYYRYQPRKITAFLERFRSQTASMRDSHERPFLERVLVHESVLARIVSGVDNYAPAALPEDFAPVRATGPHGRRLLTLDQEQSLTGNEEERHCRFERQENEWDRVWKRRLVYFLTVFLTLLLVVLPWFHPFDFLDDMCSDQRCFAQDISRTVLFFLPQSYSGWLTPWTARPIQAFVLLLLILGLIWAGGRSERAFRGKVRKIWDDFRTGDMKGAAPSPNGLRRKRESNGYQFILFDLKWRFLPLLFGWASLAAIIYAGLIMVTQTLYAVAEPHAAFCSDDPAQATAELKLDSTCTNLGVQVKRAQAYRVTIRVKADWKDDFVAADPRQGAATETRWMILGRPLKRVTNSRWLQPLTEVRADQTGLLRYFQPIVGKDIEVRRPRFEHLTDGSYVSDDLCPSRSGTLHMMVNDAAPLLVPWLYWNNKGSATVVVADLQRTCVPIPERQCDKPVEKPLDYCSAQ